MIIYTFSEARHPISLNQWLQNLSQKIKSGATYQIV